MTSKAFSMPIFGDNEKEFYQLSAGEKRLNWTTFVSELIRIQLDFEPGEFSNEGGILAYNLFLPQEDMEREFPGIQMLPFPAQPAPFAQNASNAAVESWKMEARLLKALTAARALMKGFLTTQCKEEVKHLREEISGFVNVSCQTLFQTARKTHGQLTPVDLETLRLQTTKQFNRAETLETNLGRLSQAHQRLARLGDRFLVSPADKLREMTTLLRNFHPEVAAMVTLYEQDTDVLARSWSDLVTYVESKVLRLPAPLIGGSRGSLNAAEEESATDDVPSAAAVRPEPKQTAGGQVSISKDRLKELEEAESFSKAAPVPQYCFTCGWGGHGGQRCMKMSSKDGTLRDGFTKKQTEAKKPATVDGKTGATKLWAGFRKPN